ncbi:hypothetical protein LCGC14_1510010 [marine sediment metagenome]|uniref:Uncharacterized protein n=1 Tax=marine sediment metagenome TaxID=412755 RepID=A0A0F9M2U7_9ZZZZ
MDANKTALTHRVTAIAAAYLAGLGCKPVETEVPVAPGWVADVATFWYPSKSMGKRLHLERLARQWLGTLEDDANLVHRAFGNGPFTILVEVKTSRADFKSDCKWKLHKPAHICFLAYPEGVVARHELPEGWFGLETSSDGKAFRKVIRTSAEITPQHLGLTTDFICAVAIRRAHRTQHVALRAAAKAYNAEDRETQIQYKGARLLTNLAAWLEGVGFPAGRSFDEMLDDAGIKKLPKYARDAAAYFQSLKRVKDDD